MGIFGDRLRELRLEKQLTMDMVAYDINQKFNLELTKSHFSRWESGKVEPTIRLAGYLAKYYGVSVDYLIGLTDGRVPYDLLVKDKKIAKRGKKDES